MAPEDNTALAHDLSPSQAVAFSRKLRERAEEIVRESRKLRARAALVRSVNQDRARRSG
jgi:hypothetical protein